MASSGNDRLAFLCRQLVALLDEGGRERAFERLREAAGPGYTADVDRLRQLVGSRPGEAEAATGRHALAALLREAPADEGKLVQLFVEYAQRGGTLYRTCWAGIVGQLSYLVALCSLMLVIAGTFTLFVLPAFQQMFDQFGGGLPAFTAGVLASAGIGLPLLVLLVLAVLILAAHFAVKFRRRIRSLSPLPRLPRWLPFGGAVAETYNRSLFLNFTRILLECGVAVERAVEVAARLANQPPSLDYAALEASAGAAASDRTLRELGVAARLGNLPAEVAARCDIQEAELAHVLATSRNRFSLGTSIVVGVLVAIVVIAMYLPLFRMGSLI